jgi:hypothetical protein
MTVEDSGLVTVITEQMLRVCEFQWQVRLAASKVDAAGK